MNKKGFTLIELLIVITIIGILTVLGARQFGNVTARANATTDVSNAQMIADALRQALLMGDITEDVGSETAGVITYAALSGVSAVEKYIGSRPAIKVNTGDNWYVYVNKTSQKVVVAAGTSTAAEDVQVLSPRPSSLGDWAAAQ